MIKISNIVEQIVRESDFVEMALANNLLNLTEYARYIQNELRQRTMKEVKVGAIVVALSRLKKQQLQSSVKKPQFQISEFTIKSPLCEIVYDKNRNNLSVLKEVMSEVQIYENAFLNITQSSSEIMITTNSNLKTKIISLFSDSQPKIVIDDLVGISMRLAGEVIDQPIILYSLLKGLAWKNISIVDLISTYTEFVFIVKRSLSKEAISAISDIYDTNNVSS